MRLLWIASFSLSFVACTYISPSEEESLLAELDEDGDGCPREGPNADCDDANPNACSLFVEIPYDGYDNDCSTIKGRYDEVDLDGDGIPGIDYADWLANGGDESAWPSEASKTEGLVDCRDILPEQLDSFNWVDADGNEYSPASHESAASIFPGSTNETIYDGIDSNCDGSNDFDFDSDNHIPPGDAVITTAGLPTTGMTYQEAFDAYVAEWGYSYGDVGSGDCNDTRSDVHPLPNAVENTWYDAHDQHCTGLNDFDQDLDGYTPEVDGQGNPLDSAYQTFLDFYHGGVEPAAWGEVNKGGARDCNDLDDQINVDATDTWYDGIDSNCDLKNDFDKDEDNTLDQVQSEDWCSDPSTYIEYFESWSYKGGGTDNIPGLSSASITGGGFPQFNGTDFTCSPSTPQDDFDCEPTRSDFYPGAVEILGDDFDGDCDGEINRTPLFGEPNKVTSWTNPGSLVISKNDHHYIVSTTVQQAVIQNNTYEFDGISLFFDHDAGFLADSQGMIPRDNGRCSSGISSSLDIAATADSLFFANGCQASLSPWLRVEEWTWSSGSQSYSQTGSEDEKLASNSPDLPDQIDIELDSTGETWHVWANGGLGIHLYRGDMNFSDPDVLTNESSDTSALGFLDISESIGVTCDESSCTTYDVDVAANTFVESADVSWSAYSVSDVSHHHESNVTFANTDFGLELVADNGTFDTVFTRDTVTAADAIYVNGDVYAAAVINGNIHIAWTESDGSVATSALSNGAFPDYEITDATDVAVYADEDRLVVAAANDSELRWAFFDLP